MHIVQIFKSPILNDNRILNSAKHFDQKGIKTTLIGIDNSNHEYIVDQGKITKIKTISLQSRKIFKKGSIPGYFLKVPEAYFKILLRLRKEKFDVIIVNDNQFYGLFPFLFLLYRKKVIVWDMHELPHPIMLNKITKKYILYLIQKLDLVIYTNTFRQKYLESVINFQKKPFHILNNFPNRHFIEQPKNPLPDYLKFNNSKPYVLWMGKTVENRGFDEFMKAMRKNYDKINVVIMGRLENFIPNEQETDGSLKVIWAKPEQIAEILDNSLVTYIFYNSNLQNLWFCEPNRFYQALARKVTVITGNNPLFKA